MKMKIPTGLSSKLGRQALVLQKHSPNMLFGAGVVGMVGSTVLACRATLKLEECLEKTQNLVETANKFAGDDTKEYTDNDRKKDIAIIHVQGVVAIGKLYAPSLALGVISIAALTKSHHILNERNAALTAAYVALERGFDEYRGRVIAKYGKSDDDEFRYGMEKIEVTDDKTGRKKTVERVGDDAPSIYARFFDPTSNNWSKEAEYNRIFLQCQQNWANDLLHARGHVFLNEVYDMLGLERSKAGAVVGWILSQDSDNFVDFGIFNGEHIRDFVNGKEGSVLLDFNVDGVIFDKIEKFGERLSWQKD